ERGLIARILTIIYAVLLQRGLTTHSFRSDGRPLLKSISIRRRRAGSTALPGIGGQLITYCNEGSRMDDSVRIQSQLLQRAACHADRYLSTINERHVGALASGNELRQLLRRPLSGHGEDSG